jgi:hypothetical protein
VRARWRFRSSGESGSDSISAAVAVWTCGRVHAGCFPPQPLGLAGEEQVTDLRDEEMSFQGPIAGLSRILCQAEFASAGESHQFRCFGMRSSNRIAKWFRASIHFGFGLVHFFGRRKREKKGSGLLGTH